MTVESADPNLHSLLARIADGSLGAAGAQLWKSLVEVFSGAGDRHLAGRDAPTPTEVGALAAELEARAADDEDLSRQLRDWISESRTAIDSGAVANTVSGPVSGSVVQIGNIRVERNK